MGEIGDQVVRKIERFQSLQIRELGVDERDEVVGEA